MKSRFWALTPLFVFVLLYLSVSLVFNDFYKLPVVVAFLVAAIVGFLLYPRFSFNEKTDAFSRGAGDASIMLMILIFLLAGAFAGVSKGIGAVDATIQIALSYVSPQFLIGGLFVTACFISLSLGTSVGTVVALAPIATGIGDSVPGSLAIALAAVVGGAMFGDNLSMISDTTIAATRTQGVDMREKFKVNFWIALPAALATITIYAFTSGDFSSVNQSSQTYSSILLIPYIFVLVAALSGLRVIWVLILGILVSLGIGLFYNQADLWTLVTTANEGLSSMFELTITCIVIGGIVGLIQLYGGINYVLEKISSRIKTKQGGEFGIATLTALVNAALANNTITILIVGPLAKQISDRHGIAPRRTASILDTVSCVIQGMLPYGAQILAALATAGYQVTPIELMSRLYYPYFLGVAVLVFILLKSKR